MTQAALQLLAERQWRDYQARTPRTWFAEPNALDLDDAYRLQDAVAQLRIAAGDRLIGFKVGCIGAGTVAKPNRPTMHARHYVGSETLRRARTEWRRPKVA